MASVGTYILSRDRKDAEPDPKTAPAQVLKLFGQRPIALTDLLSQTGWSEDFLRTVVTDLRRREMITGSEDKLTLTDLGLKAQYIVAS